MPSPTHAAAANLQFLQLHVRTAFSHCDVNEEVFLRLRREIGGKIQRLDKALYGFTEAARARHIQLREAMSEHESLNA
jgi:DNA transposition AAA+ family ATPase